MCLSCFWEFSCIFVTNSNVTYLTYLSKVGKVYVARFSDFILQLACPWMMYR